MLPPGCEIFLLGVSPNGRGSGFCSLDLASLLPGSEDASTMCVVEKRVIEISEKEMYEDQGFVVLPYFEKGYLMALFYAPLEA